MGRGHGAGCCLWTSGLLGQGRGRGQAGCLLRPAVFCLPCATMQVILDGRSIRQIMMAWAAQTRAILAARSGPQAAATAAPPRLEQPSFGRCVRSCAASTHHAQEINHLPTCTANLETHRAGLLSLGLGLSSLDACRALQSPEQPLATFLPSFFS